MLEGPQMPQKIETTLALPVDCFSVLCPVQFIVNIYPLVLIILHNIHTDPLDGNKGHQCLGSPQVHYQIENVTMSFEDNQMKSSSTLLPVIGVLMHF